MQARTGIAWQGEERLGKAGLARRVMAGSGVDGSGVAWQARKRGVGLCKARHDKAEQADKGEGD